jgi:hypothetical protein
MDPQLVRREGLWTALLTLSIIVYGQMCLTYSQRETYFLKLDYSSVRWWCQVEVRVNKRAQVPKTCTIMRVPEKEQSRNNKRVGVGSGWLH